MRQITRNKLDKITGLIVFSVAMFWLVVGYFVVPILFSSLPSKLAGETAGTLFEFSSLMLLVVLIMLTGLYVGLDLSIRHIKSLLMALLLVCILRFWVAPWMVEIKQAYPKGLTPVSPDWGLFSSLHGVYQLLYLVVILLLFIWGLRLIFLSSRPLHEREVK